MKRITSSFLAVLSLAGCAPLTDKERCAARPPPHLVTIGGTLLFAVLLAPSVAHADIGGAVTGLLLDKLVLPIVLGLTAAGFAALGKLIINHLGPGKIRDALLLLDDAAAHGVAYVEQAVVPALRAPDGSLSPTAEAQAAAAAKGAAIRWLGDNGLATIQKVLGLDTPAVGAQLEPRIEAKVAESKKVIIEAPSGRPIVTPAAAS